MALLEAMFFYQGMNNIHSPLVEKAVALTGLARKKVTVSDCNVCKAWLHVLSFVQEWIKDRQVSMCVTVGHPTAVI